MLLLLFYFDVLMELIFPLHNIPCKCHPTVELFILYFNDIKAFIPRGEKAIKSVIKSIQVFCITYIWTNTELFPNVYRYLI